MIPNSILLVLYICVLVGVFLGIFLTMSFIALRGNEEWSSLRFMTVLMLGTILVTYSLPFFVISLLYPTYLVDTILEFPILIHGGMILGVGIMLVIGYMKDKQPSTGSSVN